MGAGTFQPCSYVRGRTTVTNPHVVYLIDSYWLSDKRRGEYCNGLQIRRELTAPYTPQQNGPVESGLSRAIKPGHVARIEVNRLFPDVHLDQLKGVRDPAGTSLWMECVLWASDWFNRSATTANGGMLSPYEIFYGSRPPMPTLPFCKPAYHRIPRHAKLERQAWLCYFLILATTMGATA